MKHLFFLLCLIGLAYSNSYSQDSIAVYPTHWWVGMKNKNLQLMIRKPGIAGSTVHLSYPGVQLLRVHHEQSPNYLFLDLNISEAARPGTIPIEVDQAGKKLRLPYELHARRAGNGSQFAQGVHSSDFIYLIMPDRFSNGDPSNDRIPGMRDQSLNRDSIFLRHGGDLQGIINHLDYLQGLGVTTLWLTPVLENDMPNRTEHGYAATDHYRIDPRLGGEAQYHRLSDELHRRGMKLIQDIVYNHVGLYHFLKQDPPSPDWFHQWPTFTRPNYKEQTHFDPYGAASDYRQQVNGWFDTTMPDLNQNNPYLANFLIQHAIWCVEEFGVDAWRIDTYIYVDLAFMNRCNQALINEYPKITMFGETWVRGTANSAFFARNNITTSFKSNLPGVTDFQSLFSGIQPALLDPPGGVEQLYQTASNDFLYKDPTNNVIFLDNHDMTRTFSQMKEDISKTKIGLEWLVSWRGIPQMYYGTEVLMKGVSNPDGWVRLDFPGGWPGDSVNAFTGKGLSPEAATFQAFVRKLVNFRKTSSALRSGNMMQYVPRHGLYVYFRYDSKQTIMSIMNTADTAASIDFSKYAERTSGFSSARNILSGETISFSTPPSIPAMTMWLLELSR